MCRPGSASAGSAPRFAPPSRAGRPPPSSKRERSSSSRTGPPWSSCGSCWPLLWSIDCDIEGLDSWPAFLRMRGSRPGSRSGPSSSLPGRVYGSWVTGRSSRGRWQKVLDARRQSREALGRDPNQGDLFEGPPKKKSAKYVPLAPPPIEPRRDESIGVLTLTEAAGRLGVSRAELERMIGAGKVAALTNQFGARWIPTREVERQLGD